MNRVKSFIIFTNLIFTTTQLNLELIFDLQFFFKSDVILVAVNKGNDDLAKTFYKFQTHQPKAFIGTINLDEKLEKSLQKNFLTPYQHTMVVTNTPNKLIHKLQNVPLSIMASIIWINFLDEDASEMIQDLYIPFHCKFFLAKKNNDFSYEVEDVYQISENSTKIYSAFAHYERKKMKFVGSSEFYVRRKDLKGHQFVVSLCYFREFEEVFGRFWKILGEGMNFSVFSNYTDLGKVNPDGSVTGLYKLIYEHKIDGTSINYVVTNERLNVFDYIFPTIASETRMYLHIETELNWTSYIAPFSTELWITIFGWILLAATIVHLMLKKNKCDTQKCFIDSLFDILKAVSNQGASFNSRSVSLNISYFTPYLLAIILVQYYSGALLSYVTVQTRALPFRSLEQLVEDGRYRVTALEGAYALTYLRTDTGAQATTIREKKLLASPEEMPTDTYAGFKKLCEGRYIYLYSSTNITIEEDCYIAEVKTPIFYESWGIMVWKGFPFKTALTKLMRQIQFSGIEKLKQKNTIVRKDDSEDFKPLSLQLIFPIFLLHAAVLLSCSFILLIEIYFHKYGQHFVKMFKKRT